MIGILTVMFTYPGPMVEISLKTGGKSHGNKFILSLRDDPEGSGAFDLSRSIAMCSL